MDITDNLDKPIRQLQRSIQLSVVIVLARMSGCENMTAVAHFYADNKEKLKKYIYGLGDENPTP